MNERPIDGLRVDVIELQAQTAEVRAQLTMLWRHALIVSAAVILTAAWLWLAERPQQ